MISFSDDMVKYGEMGEGNKGRESVTLWTGLEVSHE